MKVILKMPLFKNSANLWLATSYKQGLSDKETAVTWLVKGNGTSTLQVPEAAEMHRSCNADQLCGSNQKAVRREHED